MHFKTIALTAAVAMTLTGCKPKPIEQYEKQEVLSAELAKAAKQKDPLQAFQIVQEVKSTMCPSGYCRDNPVWVQAEEDEVKYLTAAIKQGSSKAFATLYYGDVSNNSRGSVERVKEQPGTASSFLAHADRLAGTTQDEGVLLRHAGNLVLEGEHAVRDTTRAANFFARAWAAGDPAAANVASRLYLSNNDLRNAYLWSLRCTGKCERDAQANLDTLQQQLSPEAIKQAQQAAQDASVIELTTGG